MSGPPEISPEHRARVLERLAAENAVVVAPTAPLQRYSNDVHYIPYRPDSDFRYLTEFPEHDAVAVLCPDREAGAFVLFVRPRNPDIEVWTGSILGTEGAVAEYGADEAFPITELEQKLPDLLGNRTKVYFPLGRYPEMDAVLLKALETVRGRARGGVTAPEAIADPGPLIHELRLQKSAAELDRLREAVRITHEAHEAAMRTARPGIMEYELEAIINYTFRRRGAIGPAFATIVAGGSHGCTLHHVRNEGRIADGELALIDAGCEWQGYNADVTRTWPVNGTFSPEQAAAYDVVLAANKAAIAAVQPGATIDDVHDAAVRVLVAGLVELRILDGPVEARIEDESYKPYYMHRTSHWLGIDVHDVGGYRKNGALRALQPGMVLTIEPGLYFSAASAPPDEYEGIGIRIEDNVVVTDAGCEVLTAAIPKERADLCALIGAAA